MSDTTGLERAYRRLVACYPPSFRRENEEEMVTVLLATARKGQRRPGIAESADLIRGALRMRMGLSRAPRTVLHAVRLMYLGAVAELGMLITTLLTEGSIRAAVIQRNPWLTMAQLQPLNTEFTVDIVVACVAIALWIWLAWANGKGNGLARVLAIALFAIFTAFMIGNTAAGAALYAPAAVIAACVDWLIGLASVVLLVQKQSGPHFAPQAGHSLS
jgi:hypothetical protein